MNQLSQATSPYLLQHANNPVEWRLWDQESLDLARSQDKPIFLSIGYAACHWCHVMAHESFEDPETARILNENFIPIKVDREERPDLDSIYMSATVAITGQGGWPMSVFLTPDLKPFYAGTYFPPVRRYNLPGFKEVLLRVAEAYRFRRDQVDQAGMELMERLQPVSLEAGNGGLTVSILEAATRHLVDHYDWTYGGWGGAPKFPQPMIIEFLLRQTWRGDQKALEVVQHCLDGMSRGGMYDVVGGGFARYSVDNLWRVPHFEKMLYDNAQLAQAYLHAWQVTRVEAYKRVVMQTLDFVEREMTHPDGGFFSSLDADSEGVEGKYYVWTKSHIRAVLADESLFAFFESAYGLTESGNWEGKTILQRALDDANLSARFNLTPEKSFAQLDEAHFRLYQARETRIRPNTDDKVLTAWNGLMLASFAEAGRFLDSKYTRIAQRNANFLLSSLRPGKRLRRSWREGKTTAEVYLEDYAALIMGLVELYQTDFDLRWFIEAEALAAEMIERFSDHEGGGFFDVPSLVSAAVPTLLYRPKDLQDNATPSGNALAAEALLKLSAFSGNGEHRDLAEKTLTLSVTGIKRYPTAFARWLCAADFALGPVEQAVVIGDTAQSDTQTLLNEIRSDYRPRTIVAASSLPIDPRAPELLKDRPMIDGQPTVYLCEGFVCRKPVTKSAELEVILCDAKKKSHPQPLQ